MSNTADFGHCARAGFESLSGVHSRTYDRARDLPKLLPLWPQEIVSSKTTDHARLRAYRAEAEAYLRATAGSKKRDYEESPISKRATTTSP